MGYSRPQLYGSDRYESLLVEIWFYDGQPPLQQVVSIGDSPDSFSDGDSLVVNRWKLILYESKVSSDAHFLIYKNG